MFSNCECECALICAAKMSKISNLSLSDAFFQTLNTPKLVFGRGFVPYHAGELTTFPQTCSRLGWGMSRILDGLTLRKPYRLATRYCVICGPSIDQCLDPFSSRLCRISSSRSWTTAMRHCWAFHHISCHGCSQWWKPLLGLFFPHQSSSTSLRSCISCCG